MKRTNIYLSETQIKHLQELSQKAGLSISELIRRAIDRFIKREKGKD
jgi:metal-responsive CopG/Arc/MetJ family transcriptional regulator